MTMDELKPKQSAFIRSVGGTGALRHHLLDMGLTPKTEVTLQKILDNCIEVRYNIHRGSIY